MQMLQGPCIAPSAEASVSVWSATSSAVLLGSQLVVERANAQKHRTREHGLLHVLSAGLQAQWIKSLSNTPNCNTCCTGCA